ncbi:MAG: outer membrane beta-barrel protein [Flavobacteriales bacterium]|nr:outer membrane beta-barrel protein [Flavobacteriales bacterium]
MVLRSPFLAICLMILPVALHAQRIAKSGLGIMGGPQASMWRSEAEIYRPVPGFAAGVYLPIGVGRSVEIQPDLLASLQGTAQNLADGERSSFYGLYLQMPVNAKFYWGSYVNLQAGVQGGYLLWAQADGADVKEHLNTLDMGLNAGLGYTSYSGVDLTLRYFYGRANVLREDQALFPTSRALQVTVGKPLVHFSHRRLRRR